MGAVVCFVVVVHAELCCTTSMLAVAVSKLLLTLVGLLQQLLGYWMRVFSWVINFRLEQVITPRQAVL